MRQVWADQRPEMADLKLERTDLRPQDLRPKRLILSLGWQIAVRQGRVRALQAWLAGSLVHTKEFTLVFHRTLALWGSCPALTTLLHLIMLSKTSGTADHVQS